MIDHVPSDAVLGVRGLPRGRRPHPDAWTTRLAALRRNRLIVYGVVGMCRVCDTCTCSVSPVAVEHPYAAGWKDNGRQWF